MKKTTKIILSLFLFIIGLFLGFAGGEIYQTKTALSKLEVPLDILSNGAIREFYASTEGSIISKTQERTSEEDQLGPHYSGKFVIEKDGRRLTLITDTGSHLTSFYDMANSRIGMNFEDVQIGNYVKGGISIPGLPLTPDEKIFLFANRINVFKSKPQ